MIVSEPNGASTGTLGSKQANLQLRLRGGSQFGQLVTLLAGRTTIGSGPRSTVCLREPGIQPLHCLIVVEGSRISARPWAPDVLLNGETFEEAELAAGDVLSVGPVDLEIIGERIDDPPHAVIETVRETATSGPGGIEGDRSAPESTLPSGAAFDEEEPGPAPDDATWLESADGFVPDPAKSAFGPEDLGPAIEYHVPTLEEWEWAARENARLGDEILQLAGAQERLVQELAAVAQDATILLNRLDETERRQANEAADEAIWQAQLQEWKDLLHDLDERVGRLEREVERTRAAAPAAERSHVSTPVTAAASEIDAFREAFGDPAGEAAGAESVDDADTIAALRDFSIWNERPPRESVVSSEDGHPGETGSNRPVSPREASDPTSTSFIDRYSHLFDEDEPEAEASTPRATEQSNDIEQRHDVTSRIAGDVGEPAEPRHEDEESIEAYMAKLLQRVRGGAVGTHAYSADLNAGYDGSHSDNEHSAARGPLPSPHQFSSDETPTVPMAHIREMKRSAPAPEKATNLDALRELANQTARRAIGAHASRTHRRHAATKFIVAMLAGTTSLWLMLQAANPRDLQFITACVALMTAVYWAGQTYGSFVESIRAGMYGTPGVGGAEESSSSPPLPLDLDLH